MEKNMVESEMYYSDLWIKLCKQCKKEIMSKNAIMKHNQLCIKEAYLYDIFLEKASISKEELKNRISNISKKPTVTLYKDGDELSKEYIDGLMENLNLDNISEDNKILYGIVSQRTEARTFPSCDRVFKGPKEYSLDRFIETAVYVGEPCIVYHESKDGQWYFCKTYSYSGWIRKTHIGITTKNTAESFSKCKNFIVVTGKHIQLGYNPIQKQLSEINIDMGVRLPIDKDWDKNKTIDDMYTEGNFIVNYPICKEDGTLEITKVLIPLNSDVHEGYLKCNKANILRQIFKFQGERYGWGGEFHSRDCSALIVDTFRCFGINFPRNSGDQLKKSPGKTILFDKDTSIEDKTKVLNQSQPGDLIYLGGHVVMVVGKYKGDIYVIHDTIGVQVEEDKEKKFIPINGVTVSNLNKIFTSGGTSYLESVIGVKSPYTI